MKNKTKSLRLFTAIAFVAFAGFSAFAVVNTESEIPAQENQYWFNMNSAGNTPLPGEVAQNNLPCAEKNEVADCARRYSESQTTGSGASRTVIPSQINNHNDYRSREN